MARPRRAPGHLLRPRALSTGTRSALWAPAPSTPASTRATPVLPPLRPLALRGLRLVSLGVLASCTPSAPASCSSGSLAKYCSPGAGHAKLWRGRLRAPAL
eukprot:6860512-Alexandrium_andersonii.AAC.1